MSDVWSTKDNQSIHPTSEDELKDDETQEIGHNKE
jgi:hypothetical protein